MAMFKIYVGNISFETTEDDLRALFEPHGEIDDVIIAKDKESEKPLGYGFILMPEEEDGRRAVDAVNMSELGGRRLVVKVSHGKKKKKTELAANNSERPRRRGGARRARARGYGQASKWDQQYVPRSQRRRESLMGDGNDSDRRGGGGGGGRSSGGNRGYGNRGGGGGGYNSDRRSGGGGGGGGYSRGSQPPREKPEPKPDYDDDSFGNR